MDDCKGFKTRLLDGSQLTDLARPWHWPNSASICQKCSAGHWLLFYFFAILFNNNVGGLQLKVKSSQSSGVVSSSGASTPAEARFQPPIASVVPCGLLSLLSVLLSHKSRNPDRNSFGYHPSVYKKRPCLLLKRYY
jgi:hypothetical protein